jgi:hypothetical protein
MEVLYPRCCGLDVHKSSITACVLIAQSGKPLKHIRRFGCTTRELRELVVWLQGFGVEHVAMESTGVYWKPVWNVLESHFQIVLANAQHIKAVPGRKTDTKDCQWIAELLQHGLLRGSFIPPLVIRDLRDLTRGCKFGTGASKIMPARIRKIFPCFAHSLIVCAVLANGQRLAFAQSTESPGEQSQSAQSFPVHPPPRTILPNRSGRHPCRP